MVSRLSRRDLHAARGMEDAARREIYPSPSNSTIESERVFDDATSPMQKSGLSRQGRRLAVNLGFWTKQPIEV